MFFVWSLWSMWIIVLVSFILLFPSKRYRTGSWSLGLDNSNSNYDNICNDSVGFIYFWLLRLDNFNSTYNSTYNESIDFIEFLL